MTDLEKRLAILRRRREEILDLQDVRAESAGVVKLDQSQTGRLSRVDALQRQAIALHTQQQAKNELRRLDAAIRRCLDGSYGACQRCLEPIDPRRLDANPTTIHCIECARQSQSEDQ